jgi:hypothetical protein
LSSRFGQMASPPLSSHRPDDGRAAAGVVLDLLLVVNITGRC